jgi:hypothetical protein
MASAAVPAMSFGMVMIGVTFNAGETGTGDQAPERLARIGVMVVAALIQSSPRCLFSDVRHRRTGRCRLFLVHACSDRKAP